MVMSFLLQMEEEEHVTANRLNLQRVLKIEHTFPQVRSSTIYDLTCTLHWSKHCTIDSRVTTIQCDVSTQSDPTLTYQSSQTVVSDNTCSCTCAFELSQVRQELMDKKTQMKNQLKILYNTMMALSNAPSLEPAANTTSPCSNSTASNPHNKGRSYAIPVSLNLPVTTDITCTQLQPSLKDLQHIPVPPSTPVKEKLPTPQSPLKHPRVVTMWGTHRSTTELEVSQAIRQIGCNNLQIERRTSKTTSHRRGTWRFVILGEEQDIAYLEDNWKKMPKWWKLQHPASPKSSPDNFQQGFPFPEHLLRRPPL